MKHKSLLKQEKNEIMIFIWNKQKKVKQKTYSERMSYKYTEYYIFFSYKYNNYIFVICFVILLLMVKKQKKKQLK